MQQDEGGRDGPDDQMQTKFRRVTRACLPCRSRKQRCMPIDQEPDEDPSCRRCRNLGILCSFSTETVAPPDVGASPSSLAQLVVSLEKRLNQHEMRISQLEGTQVARQGSTSLNAPRRSPSIDNIFTDDPNNSHRASRPDSIRELGLETVRPAFNMDRVSLGPPIATLQTMRVMGSTQDQCRSSHTSPTDANGSSGTDVGYDPISRGILTAQEAYTTVSVFSKHCQPMAPFLPGSFDMHELRTKRVKLFLALCTIGSRFADSEAGLGRPSGSVVSKLSRLTALVDSMVFQLVTQPSAADVSLDSVIVILLIVQWMPLNVGSLEATAMHQRRSNYSRYSDISAWSTLGCAARFATLLGLDKDRHAIGNETIDLSRLRVWRNLLTCDCNLMLSSGLPMTVDSLSIASFSTAFSVPAAQEPGDTRITALVDLVDTIYQAIRKSKVSSGRQLDSSQLGRLNMEMDDWIIRWAPALRSTEFQNSRLPFTSWRWYRLALNTAPLGRILTPARSEQTAHEPLQLPVLQSLDISLRTATHILLALSTEECGICSLRGTGAGSPLPNGPFRIDEHSVDQLVYSVDSTWITLTFAVAFLVLAYVRGIVDDNIDICCLTPATPYSSRAPHPSGLNSRLYHLAVVAVAIFERVCNSTAVHPAHDFLETVRNAASLVVSREPDFTGNLGDSTEIGDQDLWDFMAQSNIDWGSFLPAQDVGNTSAWREQ